MAEPEDERVSEFVDLIRRVSAELEGVQESLPGPLSGRLTRLTAAIGEALGQFDAEAPSFAQAKRAVSLSEPMALKKI